MDIRTTCKRGEPVEDRLLRPDDMTRPPLLDHLIARRAQGLPHRLVAGNETRHEQLEVWVRLRRLLSDMIFFR